MAKRFEPLGEVKSRPGATGDRWRIDFGRRWAPRYLYSFRGVRFESKAMGDAILAHIQMEVAKGRQLSDVLSELAPEASSESSIRKLLGEWIVAFERRVTIGDRAPRTLQDYKRWAAEGGYFSWWDERSIWEIDAASVEEWSSVLGERGLSPKTRWNIIAGFHSFCSWVHKKRQAFIVPDFEWPQRDEHIPTTISLELQAQVIAAIDEPSQGIYIALATLGIRPSEARVLRVKHWKGDTIQIRDGAKDRRVGGVIRGPKKQRAKRDAFVRPVLAEWLAKHVSAERRLSDPEGWLFVNPKASNATKQWADTVLRRTWATACAKVGVEVSLYEGTKHSTATALKTAGVDDRVLAAFLGHADSRSVVPYARIADSTVREAVGRLK